MSEEKVRFMFALSAEGTKKLQEGILDLSSGGLRKKDGSLYEMATPVYFDPGSIRSDLEWTEEKTFRKQLTRTTRNIDKIMQDFDALKEIAWMNYAVNCRTYELTYQGFQQLIGQLEYISAQLTRIEKKFDDKEFNDRLELANKYANNLKSIAGYMEIKNFNASNEFFNVVRTLDEIEAYFERMHNELKTGTGNDQIVLASIIFLIAPYTYVLRRFSSLFYYENGFYPPNYEKCVEVLSNITKDRKVKNKLLYYLRVNTECSLEDAFIAGGKALFNLRGFIKQINFDQAYVLQHSKEEYLSIGKQLQDKYEQEDYQIIDNHLCIEI